MPPRIHLVRHGQGHHQLAPNDREQGPHDPDLTEEGVNQCKSFNSHFPVDLQVDLFCASPIRRTIQTASHCFASRLGKDSEPILLLAHAQEAGDVPHDTGSDPSKLRREFGNLIDASMLEDSWNSNEGIYAATHDSLTRRAKELRLWLRERKEKEVAICGHGVFWHYVTGDIDAEGNQLGADWENTEYRSYCFADEPDQDAKLSEDKSWRWSANEGITQS